VANATSHPDGGIVAELSRRWVENLSAQLTQAGRRLEGGWPGTLSEARRLLTNRLAAPTTTITRPEFERLVKAIYDEAKSRWLAVAERCPAQ
jgi:hypothetical protein